jgi:hypothetical protein
MLSGRKIIRIVKDERKPKEKARADIEAKERRPNKKIEKETQE